MPTVRFVENGYRLYESRAGLAELGIPVERQIYPNLPDGALARHIDVLTNDIFRHALRRGISLFVTLGLEGFDGHPDHIAAHRATVDAARRLRNHGRAAGVLAINSKGQGGLTVPVNPELKVRAAKHHSTQMQLANNESGELVLAPREVFKGYDEIFKRQETYDTVSLQ